MRLKLKEELYQGVNMITLTFLFAICFLFGLLAVYTLLAENGPTIFTLWLIILTISVCVSAYYENFFFTH